MPPFAITGQRCARRGRGSVHRGVRLLVYKGVDTLARPEFSPGRHSSSPRQTLGYQESTPLPDLSSLWVDILPSSNFANVSYRVICLINTYKLKPTVLIISLHVIALLRQGYPSRILSDNGWQFCSVQWKEAYARWGATPWTTPTYHPHANPMERRNQEIKKGLRLSLENRHLDWDRHVLAILFSMLWRRNAATSYSPAEVLLGGNIKGPGEWSFQDLPGEANTPCTAEAAGTTRPREIEEVSTALTRERNNRNNRKTEETEITLEFSIGDEVLIRNWHLLAEARFHAGFAPKWVEPLSIGLHIGELLDTYSSVFKELAEASKAPSSPILLTARIDPNSRIWHLSFHGQCQLFGSYCSRTRHPPTDGKRRQNCWTLHLLTLLYGQRRLNSRTRHSPAHAVFFSGSYCSRTRHPPTDGKRRQNCRTLHLLTLLYGQRRLNSRTRNSPAHAVFFRCLEWVRFARNPRLNDCRLETLWKSTFLCQYHFTNDQYISFAPRRLVPTVRPFYHLPVSSSVSAHSFSASPSPSTSAAAIAAENLQFSSEIESEFSSSCPPHLSSLATPLFCFSSSN
ncbi:hypothetical protein J437_LFUL008572 [Ladona fulva]|uniref:Integrase catalytic domain-containing protein n=1 Tax=Ladona fulva TaxID=123851 RepID=A0A8K0P1J3_LADFU|nr:hypothetical protein J437_LFUL008572 [Ladona fulva]